MLKFNESVELKLRRIGYEKIYFDFNCCAVNCLCQR